MAHKIPPPGGLPGSGSKGGTGGMKIGEPFRFVAQEEMPGLELERVVSACESLIEGSDCYSALTYLSRARVADLTTLMEATRSTDVKERWQRLWVLSGVFARLARSKEGQERLAELFENDLAALHMFSKFDPKNNAAVKKCFDRLHSDLLNRILTVLVNFQEDEARSTLLAGIVDVIENDKEVLRETMSAEHKEEVVEPILALIPLRDVSMEGRGNVSSRAILERLRVLSSEASRAN